MDILFDLDGTMIDPAEGIIGSAQYALGKLALPVPAAQTLHWMIGPALRTTFARLGLAPDQIPRAVELYRENYRAGAMYDVKVYDGIADCLKGLVAAKHRLIVATAKPHVFAKPILERVGLARYFQAVHGAELDGRNDDKADLIAHIIATEKVAPANAIMIGDRRYDAIGARRNGISAIGVTWGYGSADELREAEVQALCDHPGSLQAIIEKVSRGS